MSVSFPTVHLNGTSADELIRQNLNACQKVREAIEALQEAAPHGRDYYTQAPGAWTKANAEHCTRLRELERVERELAELVEHIVDTTSK